MAQRVKKQTCTAGTGPVPKSGSRPPMKNADSRACPQRLPQCTSALLSSRRPVTHGWVENTYQVPPGTQVVSPSAPGDAHAPGQEAGRDAVRVGPVAAQSLSLTGLIRARGANVTDFQGSLVEEAPPDHTTAPAHTQRSARRL